MAFTVDLGHMFGTRASMRFAAVGLAALLAAPVLTASAEAAPARPGAVATTQPLVETVAARKVYRGARATRGKVATKRRYGRRGRDVGAALLGAAAVGVLGAVLADQARGEPYYDGPVYAPQPYPYGPGVYAPAGAGYYDAGPGYDRRYWRGGPPRHAGPQPGYAPPQPGYAPPQPRHAGPQPGYAPPPPRHAGPQPGYAPRGPAPGWNGGGPYVRGPAQYSGPWPTPGRMGGDGTSASPGM